MRDHYDDSPVVARLRRAYFADESGDEIWQTYQRAFALQGPVERRSDINQIDNYIGEDAPLSREMADLFAKRRQLVDLDELLRKAGR
jgi:hypothetical protein